MIKAALGWMLLVVVVGLFIQWARIERVRAQCQLDGNTRERCDLLISAGVLKP